MRPNGERVRQLTVNDGPFDGFPDWSPDGRKHRLRHPTATTTSRSTACAPTVVIRLGSTFDEAFDFGPAWSPDGREIAFATDRDGNDEISTMRADGSRQVNRETRHPGFDIQPDWQASG